MLSDKIILLTTPNNRYFHEADLIIHLKDGKIREITADLSLAELEKIEKYTQAEEQKSEHHETVNDPNGLTSGEPLKQESEKREVGRLAFRVYKEYLLYGASAIVLSVFILVFFSGQGKKIDLYRMSHHCLKNSNI